MLIFLSVTAILISCNPESQLNKEREDSSRLGVRVIIGEKYKPGSPVVFIIENTADTLRYIMEPSRLEIQREIDSNWYDLRILHCPCGAPCAPPRYVPIEPYQEIDISWNQKESWCQGSNSRGNDKSEYVRRGKYRFVIHVNDSAESEQSDDEIIYAEFMIL